MEDPVKQFDMFKGRGVALVASAAVLALAAGGGGAVAASLITSADIKDKTIKKVDLDESSVVSTKVKDGTLKMKDLGKKATDKINAGGPRGPAGPAGAQGPQGPKGDTGSATYVGPNWSVVDRNVLGNGASYLRSGPSVGQAAPLTRPPKGIGSLGIRTGTDDDKAAFGNQVDFVGTPLSTINAVSYSVYTTTENIRFGGDNLPSVAFEVDPNVTVGDNFSTLVYSPVVAAPGWTKQNASSEDHWYFTGNEGTATGCLQAPASFCTLAEAKAFVPDATLLTVQITKGRDPGRPFSGAVDALQINNAVYDFEPFGVSQTTP
jgi:hypothetical protein